MAIYNSLEMIYAAIVKTRGALYEKGIFKSFSLGASTVSVGNITVGGTGKTPLVALVAEILAANGEKVCILSRGYGRDRPKRRILVSDGAKILADARSSGDEPFELAQKLFGKAIVVADADRVSAGNWARAKFGITAFVLDDAFQHLRVKRDVDIVTIDATNPFGGGKLLPFGILREPLKNLSRADAIVITRANLAANISNLKARIKKFNPNCPIFAAENKISRLVDLKDFTNNSSNNSAKMSEKISAEKYFAFCALGNPNNFFEQLRRENFDLRATETFPDHHRYTQKDAARIEAAAREANADVLLTTAKDAVKLKNLRFEMPCSVIESEIIFSGGGDFRRWLTSKLKTEK